MALNKEQLQALADEHGLEVTRIDGEDGEIRVVDLRAALENAGVDLTDSEPDDPPQDDTVTLACDLKVKAGDGFKILPAGSRVTRPEIETELEAVPRLDLMHPANRARAMELKARRAQLEARRGSREGVALNREAAEELLREQIRARR